MSMLAVYLCMWMAFSAIFSSVFLFTLDPGVIRLPDLKETGLIVSHAIQLRVIVANPILELYRNKLVAINLNEVYGL